MTDSQSPLPPRPRSGIGGILTGAVLGVVLTAGIGAIVIAKTKKEEAKAEPAFKVDKDMVRIGPNGTPMRFETAAVESGSALARAPVTARVQTVESLTAPSFAPLDGRVVEVAVKIGDHVKEGDRLVMVSSGDLSSIVKELNAARLSIKTKETLVQRLQLLVESRAASQNDLMVAQSELNEAKLTAAAADARLRSLTVTQAGESAYWVNAARTGTVVQLDAVRGKQVGPDKDKPIATVADLDEVLVVSDVPQADAVSLSIGMPVSVNQPGSTAEPIAGTIELVSDVLDPERQTVPIRIRVKNPAHVLRPNQYVEATFAPASTDKVMIVPSIAVVTDGATSVVFVQTAPGTLKRRVVRLGRQTKDKTEIVSGVTEGERVVVRGALLLLNAIDIDG